MVLRTMDFEKAHARLTSLDGQRLNSSGSRTPTCELGALSSRTPLDRIKDSEQLLEKIALVVPGFSGYMKKEQRREADKIIRKYLHSRLHQVRNDLQDIHQHVAERDRPDYLQKLDRLMAIFDRVSERVNHASYGYHGFFDAIKINEPELDRVIQFDTQLVDGVGGLADRTRAIKSEVQEDRLDNLASNLRDIRKTVQEFEMTFDEREDVVEGVEVG